MSRVVPAGVALMLLAACSVPTSVSQGDAGASTSTSLFQASVSVSTVAGMKYLVEVQVGRPEVQVESASPRTSDVTISIPTTLRVTNETVGFTAKVFVNQLMPTVFLPPLPDDDSELAMRMNGVGEGVDSFECDGFLAGGLDFLAPGETGECSGTSVLAVGEIDANEATRISREAQSYTPVAVQLDDYDMSWAQPKDASERDERVGDSVDECGHLLSRYVTGGSFCEGYDAYDANPVGGSTLSEVVGRQRRPTLRVDSVSIKGTGAVASVSGDRDGPTEVRLDLVHQLPARCRSARARARSEVSAIWHAEMDIVFLVSDPQEDAGFAFPASARMDSAPEPVNVALVRAGLWVPSLTNSGFRASRPIAKGNLPYAVPDDESFEWTPLRRLYASEIVRLGNRAAMQSAMTASAMCAADIRVRIRQAAEARQQADEAFRRELERDSSGGGTGSFNIPGWLCPTRWC